MSRRELENESSWLVLVPRVCPVMQEMLCPMRVESVRCVRVRVFCDAELRRRWTRSRRFSSLGLPQRQAKSPVGGPRRGWLRIHRAGGHTGGNISCGGNWITVTKKFGNFDVRNWHDDVRRRDRAASFTPLALPLPLRRPPRRIWGTPAAPPSRRRTFRRPVSCNPVIVRV